MIAQGFPHPRNGAPGLLAAAATLLLSLVLGAGAATPFKQATVTKLENLVNYGDVKGGPESRRRAAVSDVVRANNYVLTETQSRAELQYEDGSVVRIGQNTVFSFDAPTRTLTLDKGALIFYIPKGSGGGVIKTPSLTAAITGTVGKVSEDLIAILEGEVTLVPSGRKVSAGHFARMNRNRTITIAPFDMATANDGKLMNFQGPMPTSDDLLQARAQRFRIPSVTFLDTLERTQNMPGTIERLHPPGPPPVDRPRTRVTVPPPVNDSPTPNPTGGRQLY